MFEQGKATCCRVSRRVSVLYLVKLVMLCVSASFMCLVVNATSPTHHKYHTLLLNLGTPLLVSYLVGKRLMLGSSKKMTPKNGTTQTIRREK